jgi:hypothetical protein
MDEIEVSLDIAIFHENGRFIYTIHATEYPEFPAGTCGRYHDSQEEAEDCAMKMAPQFSTTLYKWIEEKKRKAH